jgi:ubiquinone/menaquinone biosynthesis C-methylase UbiE
MDADASSVRLRARNMTPERAISRAMVSDGSADNGDVLAHADYDQVEQEFNDALDVSLGPRGPDTLFEVISRLVPMHGGVAIDVGCGRGRQAGELMHRFSYRVLAIDPAPRFQQTAGDVLRAEEDRGQRTFCIGLADQLPARAEAADLVLYREMLYLVPDLVAVFEECRRVLKPTGYAVVYQLFNTSWHEPEESKRFWDDPIAELNATVEYFEQAVDAAGLVIEELIDLRSETVEWFEEHDGKAARELRAAARLIRDPGRYIEQFGAAAYKTKLNDALWFVNRMIGKLTQRVYVLRSSQ